MLTKLLYGFAVLVLVGALGGLVAQTHRLSKAQIRAVEAAQKAEEYKGSLESLERAVAARAKSDKAAQESLENRAKVAELQAAKARKENHALKEALAASPDWTREPIPDGVLDAIQGR